MASSNKPVPNRRSAEKNGSSKRSNTFMFMRISLTIVGIFLLAASAAIFAYNRTRPPENHMPEYIDFGENGGQEPGETEGVISNLLQAPERTTFLIAGMDKSLLTDTMMIGCFNSTTLQIDLISIPRDTLTTLSEADMKTLRDAGRKLPASGAMKMTEVNSYAGKELGVYYLQKQMEMMFGVKLDYYVMIDLTGFRNIVDAVGGIYMEIRPEGHYYEDPLQDLVISIPGGMQLLNGEMAEGLVRYREDYKRADLERIDVQHEFMKEFFKQVLKKETLIKNAPSLATTMISYVRTNFGINDAPKYIKYLSELSGENLNFYTLPGKWEPDMSYYIYDEVQKKELINGIINTNGEGGEEETEPDEPKPSESAEPTEVNIKKMKIQVLNGGEKDGMAKDKADQLRRGGYNVINTGDYTGTKQNKTRIMVRDNADYDALKTFFKSAVVEVDTEIPEVYDIVIVIGLSE